MQRFVFFQDGAEHSSAIHEHLKNKGRKHKDLYEALNANRIRIKQTWNLREALKLTKME